MMGSNQWIWCLNCVNKYVFPIEKYKMYRSCAKQYLICFESAIIDASFPTFDFTALFSVFVILSIPEVLANNKHGYSKMSAKISRPFTPRT